MFSPFVSSIMIFSLFSLMSLPFSIGFYSSDLILDFPFTGNFNLFFNFIFLLGSLMTVIYSIRVLLYVFSWSFGMGGIFDGSFSFYMLFSFLGGGFLTLLWGKLVHHFTLMEDFVLVSFHLSMVGVVLILKCFVFSGGF